MEKVFFKDVWGYKAVCSVKLKVLTVTTVTVWQKLWMSVWVLESKVVND